MRSAQQLRATTPRVELNRRSIGGTTQIYIVREIFFPECTRTFGAATWFPSFNATQISVSF